MQLNPQQEEVANHVEGRILTLAGPGSGKTKTLTERTGRLIRKGANPASILCLTFTNKARDEMRQRVAAVHGERAAKVFISNFHGLCGIILRRMGGPLGYTERLTVCDTDDQVDLLMQIARKKGMEPTKPQARTLAMICNDWRENLGDRQDLLRLTDGRIDRSELAVIAGYIDTIRGRNQTDFSGLLSETVRLLREYPEVREKLQKKFRFIQVDEFQDTNRAQNEIVELIAGREDNVLAVGDGDQSIYEWRGASPDGIPRFIKAGEVKTGKCKVVKLGTNYRSTPEIVAVADRLIKHCADRIPVEFSTTNRSGEPVKCASFGKPEEEAEGVAMNVEKLVRQESVPPREIAVFYRANDMSRLVEQALAKRQLPYMVVGSGSYYDRMEVKDVLSMLRFLCNPKDGISFHRIANKPARGMGDALVGRLEAFAERFDLDIIESMRRAADIRDEHGKPLTDSAMETLAGALHVFDVPTQLGPGRTVAHVAVDALARTKYDEWLKARYEDKGEYEARSANVNELVNSIAEFCQQNPRAGIADYLQSISLYTAGDGQREENAVRLMSLHASKGLEFDVVYMIGCEHGILPHEKAVKDRGDRGLEEERRLCYVGFTRARKLLRVTWCRTRQDVFSRGPTAKFKPSRPSRFLLEAGLMTPEEYQHALGAATPMALAKARGRAVRRA
jgi:DNA helicase-2/ATP-dependent DNA helicase PcrA